MQAYAVEGFIGLIWSGFQSDGWYVHTDNVPGLRLGAGVMIYIKCMLVEKASIR